MLARAAARSRPSLVNRLPLSTSRPRFNEIHPVTPPPPPPPSQSKWRQFTHILGRTTLVFLIGSTGAFIYVTQRERHPGAQLPHSPDKKTIVVLGSGWGATSLLKTIDTDEYNVVVVSPKNYFLFTPLLPSVALGTLSPRSILQPTRYVARHKSREVQVIEAEAKSVDPINKTVTFEGTSPLVSLMTSSFILPRRIRNQRHNHPHHNPLRLPRLRRRCRSTDIRHPRCPGTRLFHEGTPRRGKNPAQVQRLH